MGNENGGIADYFKLYSCSFVGGTGIFTTISTVDLKDWVLIGVSFLFLLFWLFIVNREWIKMIAFAYAERLHETLDEQI